jgi:hypothetical protein
MDATSRRAPAAGAGYDPRRVAHRTSSVSARTRARRAPVAVLGAFVLFAPAAPATLAAPARTAAAAATSLRISLPAHARRGVPFTVTLSGADPRAAPGDPAYLIAVFQPTAVPCQLTAQLENARMHGPWFYLAPPTARQRVGVFEAASPFVRSDRLAPVRTGPRRVCAYLYARAVFPDSTLSPIARATGVVRVAR